MKICTKCNIEKDLTEFYKSSKSKSGLKSCCKECSKADSSKRSSKYNESRRRYREEHKEEYRERKRKYYQNNKDKVLRVSSIWRRKSFNGRLSSYKRAALARNLVWNISDEQFLSFWQKDCSYCGSKIETIGLDRVDSNVGYEMYNLVSCCTQCNTMKMKNTREEFLNKIKQIYENIFRDKRGFSSTSIRR